MRILANKYHGIWLPDFKIALDCRMEEAEYIFVSHAHSDHVPSSTGRCVYATPTTGLLMQRRGFKGSIRETGFLETVDLPNARVTLYPAGHILGSAMIFIETGEGSLLYTGDFKTPPSPASDGFRLPDMQVDYLITEATFGLPLYRWKPHEELFDEIRSFATETLDNGYSPVFLAYGLGKSQELLMALAPLGISVQVHQSCYPLCEIYSAAGMNLGHYEKLNPDTMSDKVVITPSGTLKNGLGREPENIKTAYVSGWASLETRSVHLNVDKLIPLSDHVDFFGLTGMCEQIRPRRTYITHTPDPRVLVHWLEKKGVSAYSLDAEQVTDE